MMDKFVYADEEICAGGCGFLITLEDEVSALESGEFFHPECLTFINFDPC